MKTPGNKLFTAYIGIDWADTKHDICIQAAGEERREFCSVSRTRSMRSKIGRKHYIDASVDRLR